MSGKQHKRELKRQKEAARAAARKAERQRTAFTLIVIGVIVAIGGGLVFLSLYQEGRILAAPTPTPSVDPSAAPSTAASATPDARPVACGGTAPSPEPKPTFTAPPEDVTEDGIDYSAVIETTCGTVRLDLYEERAPETVNSFVFLAQQGFFDGLEIFRNATTIGALQTGSGTNDAGFQIGYQLPDELGVAEAEGYPPGTLAMANAGPGTAGSQFFFVYNESFDTAFADNRAYAVFGMVTEGLDVLQQIGAIAASGPQGETPTEQVYLESVTIEPGGGAAPAPTAGATTAPTAAPSAAPTTAPSAAPTTAPSAAPSAPPATEPTPGPTTTE